LAPAVTEIMQAFEKIILAIRSRIWQLSWILVM
jgi:hypothetical protein